MKKSLVAIASTAALGYAGALPFDPENGGAEPGLLPYNTGLTAAYRSFVLPTFGNSFIAGIDSQLSGVNIANPLPGTWIAMGNAPRDFGKWLCINCTIVPTPDASSTGIDYVSLAEFVTSVINPAIWGPFKDARWRPGDKFSICNGNLCVVYVFGAAMSQPWTPAPPLPFRKDDGKGYKNPQGGTTNTMVDPTRQSDPMAVRDLSSLFNGIPVVEVFGRLQQNDTYTLTVTVSPLTPAPSSPGGGGGGGGGGACVHVDSCLPDGRKAGDIKVGDVIQLGDESTEAIETRVGVVTYSKSTMARGFRLVTKSGISLLCSDTAPIWTDEGFIRAPDLLGKKVATRVDGKEIRTSFETVEVLSEVGMIEVQHITVGDRAFWAGAEHGAYILHHNKYVPEED